MPAKMPNEFLCRLVRNLQVRDGGFIPASYVIVDRKGEVYVCGEATVQATTEGLVDPVIITRTLEGYCLDLNGCEYRWFYESPRVNARCPLTAYLPVESVYDSAKTKARP